MPFGFNRIEFWEAQAIGFLGNAKSISARWIFACKTFMCVLCFCSQSSVPSLHHQFRPPSPLPSPPPPLLRPQFCFGIDERECLYAQIETLEHWNIGTLDDYNRHEYFQKSEESEVSLWICFLDIRRIRRWDGNFHHRSIDTKPLLAFCWATACHFVSVRNYLFNMENPSSPSRYY